MLVEALTSDYIEDELYLARDKSGLGLYIGKPSRNSYNEWVEDDHSCKWIGIIWDKTAYPDVKETDKEPTKVTLRVV